MYVTEPCETIECLSNSPQRLQILGALEGTYADLRDLKDTLDSSRSTLHRNLSVLEQQGWVEKTPSGYTTTTTGCLLFEEFTTMSETADTIHQVAPFLETVDAPAEIDIKRLNNPLVTTPKPGQPNAPANRLFETFEGVDHIRGFFPVVSCLVFERFRHADQSGTTDHEYIISQEVFETLRQQYSEHRDVSVTNQLDSGCVTMHLYEDDIPYGLFFSADQLVLTGYNEIGRIQALVESTSEETIEWGKRAYETYKYRSTRPHEIAI